MELQTIQGGDIGAAIEAGRTIGASIGKVVDLGPEFERFAVLQRGDGSFEIQKLEELIRRDRPPIVAASSTIWTVEAFLAYLGRFGGEATAVFADFEHAKMQAVIDYHSKCETGWCKHRVTLELRKSEEWTGWVGSNGKMMDQGAFAEFIEDRLADVIEPEGARLLELCTNLQGRRDAEWSSGVRLDNGQTQFSYVEQIRGEAKQGNLTIPNSFRIRIPVFYASQPVEISARFRWRVQGGHLCMLYALHYPERVYRSAFEAEVVKVRQSEVSVFEGSLANVG